MFELKSYDPDIRGIDSSTRLSALPMPEAGKAVAFIQRFRRIRPILLLLATLWTLGGIFALLPFLAFPNTLTGKTLTWIGLGITAWAVCLIAIVVGGTRLMNRLAASKMNDPVVQASADQVRRGDRLDLTYTQKFLKETRIKAVIFTFAMRETVTYTTSSDTKTVSFSWVFSEEQRPGRVVHPDTVLEERISFDIPSRAMHSFVSKHNRIQWFVGVRLDIPGWPDLKNRYEILVLPEAGGG